MAFPAFFTNSAENFLAAIIYFFVNFHPVGFKDGRKLRRFILHEGKKLEIVAGLRGRERQ